MFGTYTICVALFVSLAPAPLDPKPIDPAVFLATCNSQEIALVKFFADESNWKPERKAEMLLQLKVAGIVRPMAIVSSIMKHLDYYDDAFEHHTKMPPVEWEYPVYGALKKYGVSAYPELMKHLKRSELVVDGRPAYLEASLALYLLIDVSDEKRSGKEIARIRIQIEIDHSPNAEFPRLKTLLKHVLLK